VNLVRSVKELCYFIKFVSHILSTHHVIIYTTDCVQKMLINSNNCLQPAWQSCPCFGEWHADGCANGKAGVHMGRRLYLFYACVRSSRIILWRISPNSPRSYWYIFYSECPRHNIAEILLMLVLNANQSNNEDVKEYGDHTEKI
jgi:hypothetical protein